MQKLRGGSITFLTPMIKNILKELEEQKIGHETQVSTQINHFHSSHRMHANYHSGKVCTLSNQVLIALII